MSAPVPDLQVLACRALESFFPMKNAAHFLTKVTLNQLLLAPVVLGVVFSWNLVLQGQAGDIVPKIKRDLVPSMINGEWQADRRNTPGTLWWPLLVGRVPLQICCSTCVR